MSGRVFLYKQCREFGVNSFVDSNEKAGVSLAPLFGRIITVMQGLSVSFNKHADKSGKLVEFQHCPRNGESVAIIFSYLPLKVRYQLDNLQCLKGAGSTLVLRRASPSNNVLNRSSCAYLLPTSAVFIFSDGAINVLKKLVISAAASAAILSTAAQAHFQMVYTPDLLRDRGGEITLKMPFTHPAASGHVMEVDAPLEFYKIRKGKKTDLLDTVKASEWTSAENTGGSYEATVKLRGLGDHVFVMTPSPYLEASEDIYIQQITKNIVNVGSLPTDWNEELGLKTEIVPLTKPYAIYESGTFVGVVKSEGKPVPFAEIEVEYMNFEPDMQNNRFSEKGNITPPADAFVTMTIFTDANGTFTFGIPKAGQWGFAALGVGPDTEHNGKELSQDAVIWVQAHPVK